MEVGVRVAEKVPRFSDIKGTINADRSLVGFFVCSSKTVGHEM